MCDNISSFAVRLKILMRENKTTQQEFARVTDISRQAVSQYCDGSTIPTATKLLKIADYFKVSTDYLLGRSVQSYKEESANCYSCVHRVVCSKHEQRNEEVCRDFKNKKLLFEIPVPIGTTVYEIVYVPEIRYDGIIYNPGVLPKKFSLADINNYGVKVFLKPEEAKTALLNFFKHRFFAYIYIKHDTLIARRNYLLT